MLNRVYGVAALLFATLLLFPEQTSAEHHRRMADLSIAMSTSAGDLVAGSEGVLTARVTNAGPQDAENVRVIVRLPRLLTLSDAPLDERCSNTRGRILCTIPQLWEQDSVSISFHYLVADTARCRQRARSLAIVTARMRDRHRRNNRTVFQKAVYCPERVSSERSLRTVLQRSLVPERFRRNVDRAKLFAKPRTSSTLQGDSDTVANIAVSVSGPGSADAGSDALYGVTVTHVGPDPDDEDAQEQGDAQGIRLTFNPSGFLTFPGVEIDERCSQRSGKITCSISRMSVGGTASFSFPYVVANNATCGTVINAHAALTALSRDPETSDNDATVSTNVACEDRGTTDLTAVVPSVNPDPVSPGDVVRITQEVTGEEATNVVLRTDIPDGLEFHSGVSSSRCQQDGAEIICTDFPLNSPTDIAFTVPESVSCRLLHFNASVTSHEVDTNPEDNYAEASFFVSCK